MESRTVQSGFFVVHYHSHGADPPEVHAVDSQGDRDRKGSRNTTFLKNSNTFVMKSSAFHRLVLANGWRCIRMVGSHYLYEKNGRIVPVPYHGTKEMGEGLRKKLIKRMQLQ